MSHLIRLYLSLTVALAGLVVGLARTSEGAPASASNRGRNERGDVPGWVLVTVMTAGLVMVIWGVADDQLRDMLTTALNSVRQP